MGSPLLPFFLLNGLYERGARVIGFPVLLPPPSEAAKTTMSDAIWFSGEEGEWRGGKEAIGRKSVLGLGVGEGGRFPVRVWKASP